MAGGVFYSDGEHIAPGEAAEGTYAVELTEWAWILKEWLPEETAACKAMAPEQFRSWPAAGSLPSWYTEVRRSNRLLRSGKQRS